MVLGTWLPPPLLLRLVGTLGVAWCTGCSAFPALGKLKWDFNKAPAKASKQVPVPVNEEQISDIRKADGIITVSLVPVGTLVGEAGPRPADKDRA